MGVNVTPGLARLATAAGAALLLTACGGGTEGGGSTAAPPAEGGAGVVTAIEKEYSIELSETSLAPGTYTFRVENQGRIPHDLVIKAPDTEAEKSSVITGGETTEFTVTLSPGTYEVWCSVGNHRAQGMETTLTVN